jgi:glycyl-tRNA synthetase
MFIVKKNINGKVYFYLRKSVRDKASGKVKAVTLAYLGKSKVEAVVNAQNFKDKINTKSFKDNISINKMDKENKEVKSIAEVKGKDPVREKEFTSFIQEQGFIWGPEPEIYGGVSGFYTYGPIGKLLKNNVENSIRRVFNSHGLRELEGPTVVPDVVWKASGHLQTFQDKTISCSKCKSIFRADKIIEEKFDVSADSFSSEKILDFIKENNITCPNCKGYFNNLVQTQSLMMKTKVAGEDSSLRPETATVTYLPYPRFYNFFRKKFPLGVFQIGKAYRNEISPRQNVLRGREFTQAEGQMFVDPLTKNSWEKYEDIKDFKLPFWDHKSQDEKSEVVIISVEDALKKGFIKSQAYGWCIWLAYTQFITFGIPPDRIRLRQHHPDEKAFYADDAWDIEVKLNNYGWTELCGVHDRTDYDLNQHSKFSGVNLDAQREDGSKFVPHILEIAFGSDRPTFALIDIFYDKKSEIEGKTTFRIPYNMAPIQVSILPLMKKPELIAVARDVKKDLEKNFIVDYDESGSIGKRYLRSSTVGIPLALTIDYDSLKDNSVTIRDRDSGEQKRVLIKDLNAQILELLR